MLVLTLLSLAVAGCGGLSEAERHSNAGAELAERELLEEAIVEFNEAVRLDPQFTVAYYNRGVIYNDLGQHQRAIEDYDAAIRL